MINYETPNEELIKLAQDQDEEAFVLLLSRWNNLLSMFCVEYIKIGRKYGVTFQELKSIAEYNFYACLKFYDPTKSNFKTYLNMTIKQALYKYVKASEIRYNELMGYINLDEQVFDTNSNIESIVADHNSSIVKQYNIEEDLGVIANTKQYDFKDTEKNIIYLRAAGYSYDEVSKILKVSKAHTGFTLKKLRKILKK